MVDIDTLVERIRAQGALSTRPGQMGELDGISDDVEQLIAELREARAAIERVRALAVALEGSQWTDAHEILISGVAEDMGRLIHKALDGARD